MFVLSNLLLFYRCFHQTKQQVAQQLLTQFQDHEEAWTKVDNILEHSNVPQTKVKDPRHNVK